MNKPTTAIAALSLALVGVAVTAAPAMATHPQVSGVAICDTATGDNVITWTVSGDPGYPDVAGTFVSADRVADQIVSADRVADQIVGKTVTGGQTITATERLQPNVRSLELTVGIQFANHSRGDIVTNRGAVRLVDCVRDVPETPVKPPTVTTVIVEDAPRCDTFDVPIKTTTGTTTYSYVWNPTTWTWDEVVTGPVYVDSYTFRPVTEAEFLACSPQPETKVTRSEWQTSSLDCEIQKVTEERFVSTVTYTRVGNEWVAGEPVVTSEFRDREVTPEECPVVVPPTEEPPVTEPPTATPPAPVQATPVVLVTTGSDWTSTFGPWIAGAAFLGIIAGVIGLVRTSKRQKA